MNEKSCTLTYQPRLFIPTYQTIKIEIGLVFCVVVTDELHQSHLDSFTIYVDTYSLSILTSCEREIAPISNMEVTHGFEPWMYTLSSSFLLCRQVPSAAWLNDRVIVFNNVCTVYLSGICITTLDLLSGLGFLNTKLFLQFFEHLSTRCFIPCKLR